MKEGLFFTLIQGHQLKLKQKRHYGNPLEEHEGLLCASPASHKGRTMGMRARARAHKSGRVNGEAGFEIYIRNPQVAFKD